MAKQASVLSVLVNARQKVREGYELFSAICKASDEAEMDFFKPRAYVMARACRSYGFGKHDALVDVSASGVAINVLNKAICDARYRKPGGDRCPREIRDQFRYKV